MVSIQVGFSPKLFQVCSFIISIPPHLSKVKNNMNSKDVKIIIAVIVVVIIAVILYSMYERNKDENMGNLNNKQGSTLVSPMHSITSNT